MKSVLYQLNRFETYANQDLFQSIFNDKADHLWHQFRFRHSHNVTSFFMSLDTVNEARLVLYLERQRQQDRVLVAV